MKKLTTLSSLTAATSAVLLGSAAFALAPNGEGPDPDGDSNPAVNTQLFARIGDAAEAALDPPFQIVTFEAARIKHGEKIGEEKVGDRKVKFSNGLSRQICKGQLYFRYDTQCTYMAAPSGEMAALYREEWGRPLKVAFDQPVCAAALAAYPTGGQEGERYEIRLQPYDADSKKLQAAAYQFQWTNDTYRWRLMAGAFFGAAKATRMDVNIVSLTNPKKVVRFLIDDVAFIENDCVQTQADMKAELGAAGVAPLSAPAPAPAAAPKPIAPIAPIAAPIAAPAPAPITAPVPVIAPDPAPVVSRAAFEVGPAVPGVSVAITDDKCTASVLFDDASLSGVGGGGYALPLAIPLRIVGGPVDVTVDARGFVSSRAQTQAFLAISDQTQQLVDMANGDNVSFMTTGRFNSVRDSGELLLELTMAEPQPDEAQSTLFTMDSLDLTLEQCPR
ncbi:MAG: hypothetical protein ABL957_03405 [Parvularculaceae bacterium]